MAQLNLEERFKGWKERLKINIYDLHNDVASQPSYYADVAEVAAELKSDIQLAKGNLDLVKAEVSSDVRANPDKYGLEKTTEGAILIAVTLDERVRAAEDTYAEATRKHDLMQVLVTAFEHRRSMINNEVQLYTNNYWGELQNTTPGGSEGKAALRGEKMQGIRAKRARKSEE